MPFCSRAEMLVKYRLFEGVSWPFCAPLSRAEITDEVPSWWPNTDLGVGSGPKMPFLGRWGRFWRRIYRGQRVLQGREGDSIAEAFIS